MRSRTDTEEVIDAKSNCRDDDTHTHTHTYVCTYARTRTRTYTQYTHARPRTRAPHPRTRARAHSIALLCGREDARRAKAIGVGKGAGRGWLLEATALCLVFLLAFCSHSFLSAVRFARARPLALRRIEAGPCICMGNSWGRNSLVFLSQRQAKLSSSCTNASRACVLKA